MKKFVKIIAIFFLLIKPIIGGDVIITRLACDELLNGLNITFLANKMIPLKNVTSWYSPHGWLYVTVNDASVLNSKVDLNNISNKLVRDFEIIENKNSVQIGFLLKKNIIIDDLVISRFKHPNLLSITAFYKQNKVVLNQINDKRMLLSLKDNENLEIRRNTSFSEIEFISKKHSSDLAYFDDNGKDAEFSTVEIIEYIEKSIDGNNNIDEEKEFHFTYEKDYLKVGLPVDFVQGSFSHPEEYTGTEEQNKALLKAGNYKGDSIVDELKITGVESDFESRKKLYQVTFSRSNKTIFGSELGLEKIDLKRSKQTSNIYIDSNLLGLPVFINTNYVGTTPLNKPIELEYGEYKIWCVPPVSEKLPNGKTLFYKGNLVSFITVDTEVQSHFIEISQNIK
ncbi:MAG: hypothetical protein DSY99_01295 [Candidatus Neomarinimicrobiota bacterium]|nr:MAG: hypothetical protein DSY99_01295 [Candidatus Neomarinimicrobiota bacterium]